MAKTDSTEQTAFAIPMDSYNNATIKMSGAMALITSFSMLIEDSDSQMPFSNKLLAESLYGIRSLIESAHCDLQVCHGG